MSVKLHDRLVRSLGLSGGPLRASASALLDPDIAITEGWYFLAWGAYAIIWRQYRTLGPVGWMAAYHCNEIGVWRGVFMADEAHLNRAELLKRVAFDCWSGPHTLMTLIPSVPTWGWIDEPTRTPSDS